MGTPVISDFFDAFALSIVFALIALNVYLTNFIMKITDLTCDGSVALGGCTYGALIVIGMNPVIAFTISIAIGVIAGIATSAISIFIKIKPVIASIIALTAIQTFTIKLSHLGNLYISRNNIVINSLNSTDNCIIICCVVLLISIVFYRVINSEHGLAIRVFGNGKIISESLGISHSGIMFFGLGLGNGLSAAAGALIAQITGFFSSYMGSGSLVFGIAAVLMGEKIISPKTVISSIFGCFIGTIVCKVITSLCTLDASRNAIGSDFDGVMTMLILIFLMASIVDNKKERMENF